MLVTKEFTFDAAHQLVGHCDKCANLHGHTYRVAVTVAGDRNEQPGSSSEGMVIDFTDLKGYVKPLVDALDHSFIAQGNEPILPVLRETGSKVYLLGMRSTAENLATHIFDRIHALLLEHLRSSLQTSKVALHSVKVWETPTSYVEVLRKAGDADLV